MRVLSIGVSLWMAAMLVLQGCGGADSGVGSGGAAGVGGTGGIGGTGGTGTGGIGGTGTGGTGGTGGTEVGFKTGMGLAAGATYCSSTNYRVVMTLGESPGGNGAMSSSNYRLVTGVIGATQAP